MQKRTVGHAFGAAFLILAATAAAAQEATGEVISALRDKAVVLDIVARVVEREENEVWNAASSKVTIPGRPVSIKLVGTNVIVLVQFTPYKRDDGRQVLVAQGQVWVNTKDAGMVYQTTMETIPIDFGEKIYYFPLGSRKGNNDARIEIQIELKRYSGDAPPAATAPGDAKAPTDPKAPADTKAAADVKAPADPKASSDAKASADTKAPSEGKASSDAKTPAETKASSDVKTSGDVKTAPAQENSSKGAPKTGSSTDVRKPAVPPATDEPPIE
jgi:hypothetical protein